MRAAAALALAAIALTGCGSSSKRSVCPVTHGHARTVPLLGRFVALGEFPVGMDVSNLGDFRHGSVTLARFAGVHDWFYVKAVWFTPPSFFGGFTVRVKRLDGQSPAGMGSQPPGGTFTVPAGTTPNELNGWRNFPSATWVKTAGCYTWTVSGHDVHEQIVLRAKAPR